MPNKSVPLDANNIYHIYNRGINSCNIFSQPDDYKRFLFLYEKYIYPIVFTLAWVLMPNHIHLLILPKNNQAYKYSKSDIEKFTKENDILGLRKWETIDCEPEIEVKNKKTPNPSNHFAHLFSSYSKYFNLKHNRHGSLFEHPYKRKPIYNTVYLKRVLMYIHNNPVHHGFCNHAIEYPWSSYLSCISEKETKLLRNRTIEMFGTKDNFISEHNQNPSDKSIEDWLQI
ncbi:transposase [Saccharicrinis sp. 156]|uniref:transposase n=1 Tax=Saccharicrinis sp. 156 TaxID=3417574 RepID=UPI003D336498